MERIEVNVITGERTVIQLTPEEIAKSKAEWDANEAKRKAEIPEQIAELQARIDAMKAQL